MSSSIPVLKVLSPGLQSVIRNRGWVGQRHQGFPTGGVADRLSAALANGFVGNSASAPVLECTMTGAILQALRDITLAMAGADMHATIDGEPQPVGQVFTMKKDSVLTIGSCHYGARGYLAVEGGFVWQEDGDIEGRRLISGELLTQSVASTLYPHISADDPVVQSLQPAFTHDWILRVVPGPECPLTGSDFLQRVTGAPFLISRQISRMGVRLIMDKAHGQPSFEVLDYSGAVYPGTVQWPIGGEPILLGCDGQTTGGYPRVLQVIAADQHLIGQARSGDRLWFRIVEPHEAREILQSRTALAQLLLPDFTFC